MDERARATIASTLTARNTESHAWMVLTGVNGMATMADLTSRQRIPGQKLEQE